MVHPFTRRAHPVLIFATLLTTGLLTAGLLATVLAQEATPAATICRAAEFEVAVRQGPSAGTIWVGALELPVRPDGSIEAGAFTLDDGTVVPVVGQVTGRAINLLIRLPDGGVLFGVGTLEYPIGECRGAVGGPLAGPAPGDLGDWGYALGG